MIFIICQMIKIFNYQNNKKSLLRSNKKYKNIIINLKKIDVEVPIQNH